MNKKTALFVCTENRFRSPLSEHYFREILIERKLDGQVISDSAGIRAIEGRPVIDLLLNDPELQGDGIFTHHVAKMIDQDKVENSDLVITMEVNQKEALRVEFPQFRRKIKTLSELAEGIEYDISDLNDELEFDRSIITELRELIRKAYPSIIQTLL